MGLLLQFLKQYRTLLLYFIIMLFVLGKVPASTIFYLPYLNQLAQSGIAAEQNWFKAATLGDAQATESLIKFASQHRQLYWLTLLAERGNAEAQYQLAMLTDNKYLRRTMLHNAAEQNHLEALFEIGQSSRDSGSKIDAFSRAAGLEHKPSQYALYQWYWLQGEYEQALPWLALYAEQHGESALILARYLWKVKRYEESKHWFLRAEHLGEQNAKQYQRLIRDYWRKPLKVVQPPVPTSLEYCAVRLQFLATGLESMRQAEHFKHRFHQDKRLTSLPICINQPIWMNNKQLPCQNHAINRNRITCEVEQLAEYFKPQDFSHIVIFTEQGKANVNNGIMYLDLADQYSVFVHELAHFAGFVDEYPLSEKLAEHICVPDAEHPNIVVQVPDNDSTQSRTVSDEMTDSGVPEDAETQEQDSGSKTPNLAYWQQFGEDLSLTRARTCNNHANKAYKLSGRLTFMEFHDQEYIPPLYLKVWRQRLQSPGYLVPASLNIAHALEDQGDFTRAEIWRQHFIQFRQQGLQ